MKSPFFFIKSRCSCAFLCGLWIYGWQIQQHRHHVAPCKVFVGHCLTACAQASWLWNDHMTRAIIIHKSALFGVPRVPGFWLIVFFFIGHFENYFIKSDPHCDIILTVCEISFGSIYGIYFLTFYSGILSDILFWHSILALYHSMYIWYLFWHLIWHFIWHIFWHSLWNGRCRTSTASARSQWALGWGPAVPEICSSQCLIKSRPSPGRWGKNIFICSRTCDIMWY